MSEATPPATRQRSRLAVLFAIVILDLIGFGILMPVLPFLVTELGASASAYGIIVASYAAMQFVFAPAWGRLSDRIGRRPVLLFTVAGTAVSLAGLALAPSVPWLFAARILSGAFAANIGVATAYLGDVTPPGERTVWMGRIGASFGIGFLLGPAIGGLLGPYGYDVPLWFAAGLSALNLVFAVFALREPEEHQPNAGTLLRLPMSSDPLVLRFTALNFLFSSGVAQLETAFAFLMMRRFGYDLADFAWILVLMAVVMGTIQGGGMRSLAGRFGERRLLLSGLALMAVAFALVPSMSTVAWLLVPLVVSAVGRGISQPSMSGLVSIVSADDQRGTTMGSFQSGASLARVFAPVTAGFLYDQAAGLPFWLAGVLMTAALALSATLPRIDPDR